MATREIPPDSWIKFFDEFSRRHEGWLVDVQVLGPLGAQREAENRPLEGISAAHGNKDISIATIQNDKIVEHFIIKPSHVLVEEEEGDGGESAIEIESSDGEKTLVTFRSAMPSEMGDRLPGQTG